jgi:hypothetical protein
MKTTIVTYAPDGTKTVWLPTTLDQIGKDEQYLESVIAKTPELLHLETRRTGVYGPYAVFRQLTFYTPQSRQIIPDILLVAASGDIIVVEVKLFANPELRDRRVIAQAIDYAASLSALSDKELARLFSQGKENDWMPLVNSLFPDDKDPEELAATLLSNIKNGKIHVIVACDKAPAGLYELAKSVSVQSYLSFSLDVLEIFPFLPNNGASDQIMFVPNVRLSTEIVARTAIAVTYQQGSPEPSVNISTTSIEEIEKNITSVAGGETRRMGGRDWSDLEIEDAFLTCDDPTLRELFLFAKAHSAGGRFKAAGPKKSASFGFYIRGLKADGTEHECQVFNCQIESGRVVLYLNQSMIASITPPEDFKTFRKKLLSLFGTSMKPDATEPNIPISVVSEHLQEFKETILWLQTMVNRNGRGQQGQVDGG